MKRLYRFRRIREDHKLEIRIPRLGGEQILNSNIDELVKSPKIPFFVIPAKAGIQCFHTLTKNLEPVFQRGDDFLQDHQYWNIPKIQFKTKPFL
jgi:hypothetical protein